MRSRIHAALAAATFLILSGCSGTSQAFRPPGATTSAVSQERQTQFVYLSSAVEFAYASIEGSNTMLAFQVNTTTGALTQVGSPVSAGASPYGIRIDHEGGFAYVANSGYFQGWNSNNVSAYAIDPNTGALTQLALSPFVSGRGPVSMAIYGSYAYVVNFIDNSISGYAIKSGTLKPLVGFPQPTNTSPYDIKVAGAFAYVTNAGTNTVSAYAINTATGALSSVGTFAAGSYPIGLAVDPMGKFVYTSNQSSNDVSAYTIDSTTGMLTQVTGSPFGAGHGPTHVTVDRNGKFVYVANAFDSDVSAYTINTTTGALSPVPGSPFAVGGGQAIGVAVDATGKFAYVASYDGNIYGYAINSKNGALTPVAGSPFPAGGAAADVAFCTVTNGVCTAAKWR